MHYIVKKALQQTYNRAIDENHEEKSFWSAVLGDNTKFRSHYLRLKPENLVGQLADSNGNAITVEHTYAENFHAPDWQRGTLNVWNRLTAQKLTPAQVRAEADKQIIKVKIDTNLYNRVEYYLFYLGRIAKNLAKVATEFAPRLLTVALEEAARVSLIKQSQTKSATANTLWPVLAVALKGLSYLPWLVAKAGQTVTSPLAAVRTTGISMRNSRLKPLASIAVALHALAVLLAWGVIGAAVAPASISVFAFGATVLIGAAATGLKSLLRRLGSISGGASPDRVRAEEIDLLEKQELAPFNVNQINTGLQSQEGQVRTVRVPTQDQPPAYETTIESPVKPHQQAEPVQPQADYRPPAFAPGRS